MSEHARSPDDIAHETRSTRQSLLVGLLALVIGLATFAFHEHLPLLLEYREGPLPPMYHWDSQSYLSIARGDYWDVASPFSKRALYPFLARSTSDALGISLDAAFLSLNLIAFGVFAYGLARCLAHVRLDSRIALLFLLTPFPLASLELAYMPDLFHMALVACFFWLLFERRWLLALLVLFAAFATRESTLLLCLVCAGVAFLHRQRPLFVGSLIVLCLGVIVTSTAARFGRPNVHHLPDALYLALKIPYNFALNILGVEISTNVIPGAAPIYRWQLPSFLHVGLDREIGVSFNWRRPATTLLVLLSAFGTGPLIAWKFRRFPRPASLAIKVSTAYGLICCLLGPSLGSLVDRLVGYGWPLFWITMPWLLRDHLARWSPQDRIILAACYLLASWWPSLNGFSADTAALPSLAAASLLAIPYFVTIIKLRQDDHARA